MVFSDFKKDQMKTGKGVAKVISKGKRTETTIRKQDILWFIFLRMIISTSLLVSAIIIQYSTATFLHLNIYYCWIILTYFLSAIYFILYQRGRYYSIQVYVQIFFDLLMITALVYISGGLNGSFYFLYIFEIIAASIVLSKRIAYITAAFSCVFFGVLVDGMYYGIIPLFGSKSELKISVGSVINSIFIAWSVFFLVAFLINYITESLRRTRKELHLTQKELEVKKQLAIAGEASATLAHEIRNPLAAISGSVQVLRDSVKLDLDEKKLMDIVVDESTRVSHTIQQFLNFASSGQRIFSTIDLATILKETLTLLRRSGELNGQCDVRGNYDSIGVPFYGCRDQFKQIFWNIITNAIKAMPDGGDLTIDFKKNNKVKIKISDTGRGMTEEELEKIFIPFYSGFCKGSGIGMSVVRRIVDDYDGRISVSSQLNKGTDINITLPQRDMRR